MHCRELALLTRWHCASCILCYWFLVIVVFIVICASSLLCSVLRIIVSCALLLVVYHGMCIIIVSCALKETGSTCSVSLLGIVGIVGDL